MKNSLYGITISAVVFSLCPYPAFAQQDAREFAMEVQMEKMRESGQPEKDAREQKPLLAQGHTVQNIPGNQDAGKPDAKEEARILKAQETEFHKQRREEEARLREEEKSQRLNAAEERKLERERKRQEAAQRREELKRAREARLQEEARLVGLRKRFIEQQKKEAETEKGRRQSEKSRLKEERLREEEARRADIAEKKAQAMRERGQRRLPASAAQESQGETLPPAASEKSTAFASVNQAGSKGKSQQKEARGLLDKIEKMDTWVQDTMW